MAIQLGEAAGHGQGRESEMVTVVAPDGATSSLRLFPSTASGAPVVLSVPGMGIEAGFYVPYGEALRARGVHAGLVELRGYGTSSLRASRDTDYGYATLVRDLGAAVETVRARFPGSPLFLSGHSLGGQLSLLFAASHPDARLDGIVLVASGTPYFRAWPVPTSWALMLGVQLCPVFARLFGYFPGHRFGFAGREARGVIGDWARLSRTGRFAPTGWTGPAAEEVLSSLRLPILAVSLEGDRLAPIAALGHLLGKVPRAEVERWHYDPLAIGAPPVTHIHWPRRPDAIADHVARWVTTRARAVSRA